MLVREHASIEPPLKGIEQRKGHRFKLEGVVGQLLHKRRLPDSTRRHSSSRGTARSKLVQVGLTDEDNDGEIVEVALRTGFDTVADDEEI